MENQLAQMVNGLAQSENQLAQSENQFAQSEKKFFYGATGGQFFFNLGGFRGRKSGL